MSTEQTSGKPRVWRRKYLIDKPTQLGVARFLVAALVTIAVAYVAALLVFFRGGPEEGLDAPQVRDLLMKVNLAYLALTGAMIVTLAILLTHRFVGAAHVFRVALRGMLEGEFDQRLTLRKSDFFQDIAAYLDALRERVARREESTEAAVERIERAAMSRDVDEALAAAKSLREGALVRRPAAAPPPERRAAGALR